MNISVSAVHKKHVCFRGFLGIERFYVGGIVSSGCGASTMWDAHVRGVEFIEPEDGCAAFSRESAAIKGLRDVTTITSITEATHDIAAS
jgi:nicotinamidase-related amidase